MPESPPKRITRARARAAEQEPTTQATKKTRAAAAPVKPAATRINKRKTRADDVEEDAIAVEELKPSASKQDGPPKAVKGRSKKAAPSAEDNSTDTIVTEPAAPAAIKIEQPKTTRGRTRKAVPPETKPKEEPEKEKPCKPKKAHRPQAPAAEAPGKPVVTRKKVSFQDEHDKENILPTEDSKPAPSPKKAPEKATGLKARPVRKPLTGRSTRSTRKVVESHAEKKEEKDELPPLSPKKAKQIPLMQAASDDDELSGAKTPLKALSKSPTKVHIDRGDAGENRVSKLDFSASIVALRQDGLSTAEVLHSGQSFSSSILGSPARRPPSSPFKDLLKKSPKKINLSESTMQPSVIVPPTTLKSSLLQSPAKRPRSPNKGMFLGSPKKVVNDHIPAPFGAPDSKPLLLTSDGSITSLPQVSKSPARSVKVHKMTVEEQFEQEEIIEPSSPLLSAFEFDPIVKRRTPARPVVKVPKSSAKPSRISTPVRSPPASPTQHMFSAFENAEKIIESAPKGEAVVETKRSTTPPGLPLQTPNKAFAVKTPPTAYQFIDDSDSEDELQPKRQDYSPTPSSQHRRSAGDSGASLLPVQSQRALDRNAVDLSFLISATPRANSAHVVQEAQAISLTPLVSQFGNLAVGCSESKPQHQTLQGQLNQSLPLAPKLIPQTVEEAATPNPLSPVKSSFFDDEMSIREQQQEIGGMDEPPATEISEASQEYGDENAIPIDPRLLTEHLASPATCTPSKVFSSAPQEIHTVQRVPLKPGAGDSTSKPQLKRSASFFGRSSPRKEYISSAFAKDSVFPSFEVETATPAQHLNMLTQAYTTPAKSALSPQWTPATVAWSMAGTPARTPRRYLDPATLKGAIVYVDVHTAEGADASGIFVDLLTQMGARCVKQWNWNPNTNVNISATNDYGFGIGGTDDGIKSVGQLGTPGGSGQGCTTPGGKIGITHVVFKDGGVRTLQKVRESKGVVLCVGVGWVLDCEREGKWLDEGDYAVDISAVPRGGHRRRKSMEPRALANINGTLVPSDSPAAARYTPTAAPISPTEEFLTFDTPASRRESFSINPPTPETPKTLGPRDVAGYDAMSFASSSGSPATPYFLHAAEITQHTCPPKQQFQPRLLFPMSGRIEDEPDVGLRQRLLLARRKSLQWAPKVGSPLGRAVSYAG